MCTHTMHSWLTLDETDGLINRSTDRKVVHGNLSQDALRVDDEKTSKRNSSIVTLYNIVR